MTFTTVYIITETTENVVAGFFATYESAAAYIADFDNPADYTITESFMTIGGFVRG